MFNHIKNMKQAWMMLLTCFTAAIQVDCMYTGHFVDYNCRLGNETIVYEVGGSRTSVVVLTATEFPPYLPFRDCTIELRPKSFFSRSQGIHLSIAKLDFVSSSLRECTDYIQVYSIHGIVSTKLCGFRTDPFGIKSYSVLGSMYLRYRTGVRTDAHIFPTGFQVVASAYSNAPCESDEFRCGNGKCIWKGLTCNGFNNCGDRSDERYPTCSRPEAKPDFTEFYVILFSCCITVTIITIASVTVWYIRRRRRSPSDDIPDSFMSRYPPIDRPPPYTVSADPLLPTAALGTSRPPPPPDKEDPPPYEP